MVLSIVVSGAVGFLLEYVGVEVLHAFANSNPMTLYAATAIWAFGLGPLLVALRRASILVPMLVVGIAFAILVLFNNYHFIIWEFSGGSFVDTGKLWAPRIWEFRKGAILGLEHPLLIALAAGAIETIVVPVSVLLQKLLTAGRPRPAAISIDDVGDLFRSSVIPPEELRPSRDFGFFLMRFIFFAYGTYFMYMVIGLLVNGRDLPVVNMMFINPPETVNTVMKLTLMISLAAIGAYNVGIRRQAAIFLTIGHMISVVSSLALYFGFDVNPVFPMDQTFLLSSVAGDGLLVIGLVYLIAGPARPALDPERIEDIELRSPASSLVRAYFLVFGALFTLFTAAIVYFRWAGDPLSGLGAVFGGPDPLVSNSLTKYGTLAALGWTLFGQSSIRKYFVPVLALGFTFSLVATVIYGFQGSTVLVSRLGSPVTLPWFMMQHIIVDGLGLTLLLALRRLQYHVDFQITSLRPGSAECSMALHEAMRESSQEPEASSGEVLRRIDGYIASIHGRRRGLVSFPFWLVEHVVPLVSGFRPPFSTMSREERRWFLRSAILRPNYERAKATLPPLADLIYQMGDITHALVSMAYFTTGRAHAQIGYIAPDARKRLQPDIPVDRPPKDVDTLPFPATGTDPVGKKPISKPSRASTLLASRIGTPPPDGTLPDEVDYCIVGSGAAGGILAYRLGSAKGENSSICVLERGGYYTPRADFSDDEMRMFSMLYAEGGLQMTRSFDFTILQGECVGGTTVINNAVCFRMPEVSTSEWKGFGIDTDLLGAHYDRVAAEINIAPVSDESVNTRAQALFTSGVANYNATLGAGTLHGMGALSPVEKNSGNFLNCLGCGLCNIGCRYMRKLSVLETYIPWAQSHNVAVRAAVAAVQCETEPVGEKKRVTSVIVRTQAGEFKRIRIRKALIVAGGAIASSRFLMRSGVGGDGVGKFLSCNFAVPPLVEFPEPVNAFDGLQMALFAFPGNHEAVFETTFNAPGSFAIAVPLYLRKHAELMAAFTRTVNFTALVGSDPAGSVSPTRDLLFGRAIDWAQTPNDIQRIKMAMSTVIRIAAAAGARRVYLPTHPVLDVLLEGGNAEAVIAQMDRVLHESQYFNFVTAHPQGGNLMADESFQERVVDLDFRVRDCENLFVCDASVFPRGVRVNPQWTIMALASAAGERIAQST
jgi:choline dehydrogenase-like flavoprotein